MSHTVESQRDYWPTKAWRTALPETHGLHADLPQRLRAFGEDPEAKLNGIVVVRHGYLVGEEYFGDFHAGSLHTIASVTKSVVALLTGVALGQHLLSLDQPLSDWFPE